MVKAYFEKWTYKRILQLIVGLYFVWNYLEDDGVFAALFGGMMSFQALFNVGCFSTRGCSTAEQNSGQPAKDFAKNIKKIKLK